MDYQSVNKMKNRMNTSFTKSYLLLLVAIVVSCTFTEPVSRPPSSDDKTEMERVASEAIAVRSSIYGEDIVKSSGIGGLSIYRLNPAVKSASSMTPYLVNYPDNGGYAILVAEEEEVTTLMIGDAGNMDPQAFQAALNGSPMLPDSGGYDFYEYDYEDLDPEDAPHGDEGLEPYPMDILPYINYDGYTQRPWTGGGPNPYIDMIGDYINGGNNLGDRPDTMTSTIPGSNPRQPDPFPDSLWGIWLQMDGVKPLLRTAWHQDSPYNQFCPVIGGKNALAGCVPVATSQILAYLEPPKGSWDWDAMTADDAQAEVLASEFIYYAGRQVNAKYDTSGTSSSYIQAKKFLQNMGCEGVSIRKCEDYNKFYDRIIGRLRYHLPVYIRGVNSVGEGHAYVIDGFLAQKKYTGSYTVQTRHLFHVNWGWGVGWNGYFLSDLLDCRKKIKDWETETKGSSEDIYDGRMRTITYKKPNWR